MATLKICDRCGKEAVDTITAGSKGTTVIVLDVCEEHLASYKQMLRFFTGQDKLESLETEAEGKE